jgi:hypothetical protein
MCEPASLALAALTSFKEVYLICRFVYEGSEVLTKTLLIINQL